MYGLPITTEVKKQLPKKAIYAKFDLNTAQRDAFDADISRIDIVAVVSPATVPALGVGEEVKEFYVLAVQLKRKEYDNKNIALLTKLIPQKMVLALQFEERTQLAIFHTKLIFSEWRQTEETSLSLTGLYLDAVWEGIVKQIGNIQVESGNTLKEQIAADDQLAKFRTQIDTLERKMASEKQPRRKREYFEQIKKLKMQCGE